MKKHLNSIYGKAVYDLDKIYGEDDMEKRKFIVVHRAIEEHPIAIVFCDSITAYTENEIRLSCGSRLYCIESAREICELLHSKGVI